MLTALPRKDSRGKNHSINRFKVLEEVLLLSEQPLRDIICHSCKQRHYLIERKTDNKNLFCTHCGALTPIRSVKHGRGLAAPPIQLGQQTAITQSKNVRVGRDRLPSGIHTTNKEIQSKNNC
jgi:hypothetical protein